jgi:cytochrome c-type biogenesis protein CcmF
MAGVGFGLLAYRYKELPTIVQSSSLLSREFLIFSGAMLLCALAGVIILGTSTPIIGRLFRESPSGVPIEFYNKWTLPVAVITTLLLGLGQMVWWTKMRIDTVNKALLKPLALSVLSTAAILVLTPFTESTVRTIVQGTEPEGLGPTIGRFVDVYGMSLMLLLLLFTLFFAFYGNALVAWRIARGNLKMAGGALSHIGFALMLLGALASSALNDPLSQSDNPVRRADGSIGERGNFVIERGQTLDVENYSVSYTGSGQDGQGHTFYRLLFEDDRGRAFEARPVAFQSGEMWVQNPFIKTWFEKDLFVAVSPNGMFGEEEGTAGQISIARGATADVSDRFRVMFEDFEMETETLHGAGSGDISVAARLRITDRSSGQSRVVLPIYIIRSDRTQHFESKTIPEWDLTVSFAGMNVDSESINLFFEGPGIDAPAPDWLLVQAYEKPFINLLWLGSIILLFGFGLSFFRRAGEARSHRNRRGGDPEDTHHTE